MIIDCKKLSKLSYFSVLIENNLKRLTTNEAKLNDYKLK